MYPEYIEVNGNEYKINTDYRIALQCLKIADDTTISDYERFYAILGLLLGPDVKSEDETEAFKKCAIFLRCGNEENPSESEIDMDYEQDKGYINASFRSCYQIDIKNENMHWWEYNELIAGFGEKEILSQIRYIRNKSENECTSEKEKQELRKQKQQVALKKKETPKNEEQLKIDDCFNKLLKKGE